MRFTITLTKIFGVELISTPVISTLLNLLKHIT